jgi:hypothetical protein
MKKILILFLVLSLFLLNCASSLTVNGEVCEPVGLFNQDEKCENVKYKFCTKNLIWSILAFETVIVPVILLGKKLYEPVELDTLIETK